MSCYSSSSALTNEKEPQGNLTKSPCALRSIPSRSISLPLKYFFLSDRCILKEQKKVEAMFVELTETLRWLLARNHSDDNLIFPKLVAILTELRTISVVNDALSRQIVALAEKGVFEVPELIRELHITSDGLA